MNNWLTGPLRFFLSSLAQIFPIFFQWGLKLLLTGGPGFSHRLNCISSLWALFPVIRYILTPIIKCKPTHRKKYRVSNFVLIFFKKSMTTCKTRSKSGPKIHLNCTIGWLRCVIPFKWKVLIYKLILIQNFWVLNKSLPNDLLHIGSISRSGPPPSSPSLNQGVQSHFPTSW